MIINLIKLYSGINLHIDLVLPDDPDEEPAKAILKCRSHYLASLRGRTDFMEFLETITLEEAKKVNPLWLIVYSNNDFFGEKELSIKFTLSAKGERA